MCAQKMNANNDRVQARYEPQTIRTRTNLVRSNAWNGVSVWNAIEKWNAKVEIHYKKYLQLMCTMTYSQPQKEILQLRSSAIPPGDSPLSNRPPFWVSEGAVAMISHRPLQTINGQNPPCTR